MAKHIHDADVVTSRTGAEWQAMVARATERMEGEVIAFLKAAPQPYQHVKLAARRFGIPCWRVKQIGKKHGLKVYRDS